MPILPASGSPEDPLALLPSSGWAIIYKHSPICGASSTALREIRSFSTEQPMVPVYQVDVLGQRSLSQAMEDRLGIRHESPQVILFHDRLPVWNASHFKITRTALLARMESGTTEAGPR